MLPLVTVIVTSYNHGGFIEESLRSVLIQSADNSVCNLEVLVIDDGSTDDTMERLRQIRDSRLTVFANAHNRGRNSRNWALGLARGNLIAFQNSDDVWLPGKLAAQIHFLESHPEYGVCFTGVDLCDEHGAPCNDHPLFGGMFRVEQHDRFGWLRRFFLEGNCLSHPSSVVRRSILEHTGFFDPGLFQLPDFDLWVRAAAVTELMVLPEPLVRFRVHSHGGNVSAPSPSNLCRHTGEMVEVLQQYGNAPILSCLDKVFGFEVPGDGIRSPEGEVVVLMQLGLLAASVPTPQHRVSAVWFLREALRRSDKGSVLTQEKRGALVHTLLRISGEPWQ